MGGHRRGVLRRKERGSNDSGRGGTGGEGVVKKEEQGKNSRSSWIGTERSISYRTGWSEKVSATLLRDREGELRKKKSSLVEEG